MSPLTNVNFSVVNDSEIGAVFTEKETGLVTNMIPITAFGDVWQSSVFNYEITRGEECLEEGGGQVPRGEGAGFYSHKLGAKHALAVFEYEEGDKVSLELLLNGEELDLVRGFVRAYFDTILPYGGGSFLNLEKDGEGLLKKPFLSKKQLEVINKQTEVLGVEGVPDEIKNLMFQIEEAVGKQFEGRSIKPRAPYDEMLLKEGGEEVCVQIVNTIERLYSAFSENPRFLFS